MGVTLDFGNRIELVSMDPHFQDITIGLYERSLGGAPEYFIHSYSGLSGTRERLDFLIQAMVILGGLTWDEVWLRFPCGFGHKLAVRRVFLEACKIPTGADLAPKPLTVLDKRLDRTIKVTNLTPGLY